MHNTHPKQQLILYLILLIYFFLYILLFNVFIYVICIAWILFVCLFVCCNKTRRSLLRLPLWAKTVTLYVFFPFLCFAATQPRLALQLHQHTSGVQ